MILNPLKCRSGKGYSELKNHSQTYINGYKAKKEQYKPFLFLPYKRKQKLIVKSLTRCKYPFTDFHIQIYRTIQKGDSIIQNQNQLNQTTKIKQHNATITKGWQRDKKRPQKTTQKTTQEETEKDLKDF